MAASAQAAKAGLESFFSLSFAAAYSPACRNVCRLAQWQLSDEQGHQE
jgi:hypothetical protein